MRLVFTTVYTRRVKKLLSEDDRQAAEDEIAAAPLRWPVIAGTGGVRKARASRDSAGKRGGVRIIYFYWPSGQIVYMLSVYSKNEQSDLSAEDKKALRRIVESLKES